MPRTQTVPSPELMLTQPLSLLLNPLQDGARTSAAGPAEIRITLTTPGAKLKCYADADLDDLLAASDRLTLEQGLLSLAGYFQNVEPEKVEEALRHFPGNDGEDLVSALLSGVPGDVGDEESFEHLSSLVEGLQLAVLKAARMAPRESYESLSVTLTP